MDAFHDVKSAGRVERSAHGVAFQICDLADDCLIDIAPQQRGTTQHVALGLGHAAQALQRELLHALRHGHFSQSFGIETPVAEASGE